MRLILLSFCAAAGLIMVMNPAAAQTPGTQPTVSPILNLIAAFVGKPGFASLLVVILVVGARFYFLFDTQFGKAALGY